MRYEVYEHQEPEETQRLELVSEYVVNCTDGLEVFNATWMLLAEWSDCQPRGNTNPGNLVRLLVVDKVYFSTSCSFTFASQNQAPHFLNLVLNCPLPNGNLVMSL